MDSKKLHRERDQLRRVFNRHESTATSQIDFEFLNEKYNTMLLLNTAIQDVMLNSEDFDQTAYEKECDECDVYHRKWLEVKQKRRFENQNNETCKQEIDKKQHLNLPRIEIRKFDDNPKSWLAFWGQYKKIHEDSSMDAETKFQYLAQAMTPGSKARDLVENYPPTEENYEKVIKTLKDRFAKDEILIEIYVRELLKLVVTRNNLATDVLFDKITVNLQVLESLGIGKNKYECILLPLIESSLPDNILLEWTKLSPTNEPKLDQLLHFLKNVVEAENRLTLAKIGYLGTEDSSAKTVTPTAACLLTETKQVKQEKTAGQSAKNEGKEQCYFCDKSSHTTFECRKANSFSLDEKKNAIKKKGGCYICLKKGHLAENCKTFIKCLCCSKRHLLILCPVVHDESKTCEQKTTNKSEVTSNFSSNNATTLLQTLIVTVSANNRVKKVRALLDSGSQRTYLKTKLAQELELQVMRRENLTHSLFGGVRKATQTHRVFEFQVSNLDNSYSITMTGLEQEVLCGDLPRVCDTNLMQKLQNHKIHLTDADKDLANIKDIEILIGSDYLGSILDGQLIHVTDKLVAVNTKLGWTLQGPIEMSCGLYSNVVTTNFASAIPDIDNSLEFLWNVETLGIKDPYDKDVNDVCLDITENHEGRYEVSLVWKEGPQLESNYKQAEKRLYSTTKKLQNMKKLEDYQSVFKDWEKEGIIEVIQNDNKSEGHYLPHHAVFKLESTTTKIRPVFDASCKDSNKRSLNSCIEKGPNLIELIPKLLMLFRAGNYGVIADIRKAFLQISVSPADREYLKLLWWKDPQTRKEIITYRHARVPFGVACSPYLLAATITHHLEKHTDTYQETAKKLKESFYVDNCVASFDTKKAVKNFIKEASELMEKGKFELRGWISNLENEERNPETLSVLGIQWDRNKDELLCNFNLKSVPNNITKRELLSITQQIFDPIGFLCPVTLIPKLITQKAWLLKSGWDEQIPAELEKEYKDWIHTIDCLQQCRIPRRLAEFPLSDCNTTLHVFCDASKDAYAASIFLRTEYQGKVTVQLITAKSRVAPIKRQMTLPRLELMGALIAARLCNEVVTSGLLSACKEYKVYCWTDSAVVLAWLQRQDTWKIFVTNRVKEISTITDINNWNHLPGKYNPADLPSRGCDSKTLLDSQWWMGPQWLHLEKEKWPKSVINYTKNDEEIINSEQNRNTTVNMEIISENFSDKLLYFNQYHKIVRLIARLLRLSPRIRKTYEISSTHIGYEEYKNAEETLIKIIQRETYTEENNKNKKLITIKEKGILKVKTRLEYSREDKNFIYPILLPGKNEIVERMIRQKHLKMSHAGSLSMMTSLRNTYWITGIRRLTKKVISQCITCKRYKAKHYEAPEPPLPEDRICNTAAYEVTGIDLAGPLFLRGNKKCYIVLFTCAVYRAIHLELTDSVSTAGFMMSLRRFISRRGRPRVIYTDNGTNFVGTANLLQEVNWQEIENETNCYNIQWKFSVPAAPWWGGWWERLVRLVKDMLRRILGKASLDWIELSTVLCDCEAVINSRPLTYVEMGDIRPLTPMMFLQGLSTNETPDLDQIDHKNLNIRFKYLQQLRDDFRKRFKSEYLGLIVSKGKETRREPKVGEIVLIETDSKRINWPIGLIKEVFIGKDGCTRAARVQTASGVKVRPYQRLFPLEISAATREHPNNLDDSNTKTSDPEQQTTGSDSGEANNTSEPSVSIPPVSTTRSGRKIKLPFRFLDI